MSFSDEVCADVARDVQWMQYRIEALEAENARLKIALLRRMAERADCLRSGWTKMACLAWASRRAAALDRFRSVCLAKITELKESQCLTKSKS